MLTSNHILLVSHCYHVCSCKPACLCSFWYFHTMCSSNLAFPQSQNNSIAFSVSEKALCNWPIKHQCPIHLGEAVLNCKATKQLFLSYGATT